MHDTILASVCSINAVMAKFNALSMFASSMIRYDMVHFRSLLWVIT